MKAIQNTVSLRALPLNIAPARERVFNHSGVFSTVRGIHYHPNTSAPCQHGPCRRELANTRRPTITKSHRNIISHHHLETKNNSIISCSNKPTIKQEPTVHHVFEKVTGTWQYIVADPSTNTAVIIDPVLDYDPVTQRITTAAADSLLSIVREKEYKVSWILETHAHADHLSAASYLQKQLSQIQTERPTIGIGKRIGQVQTLFAKRYGIPPKEHERVFDKLFEDDEVFHIGSLQGTAIHLPGHTPDHLGYHIGDNVFCGDSLFHPDIGTARCDFPGGSSTDLWKSARKLLSLPDDVKIWTGHDYPPAGRATAVPWMSVKEHREQNKHLKDGISEDEFVKMRNERDSGLGAPRLLHQSLQINVRAGRLPEPSESGMRLLHLPLQVSTEW